MSVAKRYQVFVSSTRVDLEKARLEVIQALLEADCIPAGMELFPASDEDQWAFIQRVIQPCDYYLLIVAGRYGSVGVDGVSYTEKEYDYAVEQKIPIIALVHDKPEKLHGKYRESDADKQKRLEMFRSKVLSGRLVKMWRNRWALPGLVAQSINHAKQTYPRIGWVRGDEVPEKSVLLQLNEIRQKLDLTNERSAFLEAWARWQPAPDLAQGDDVYELAFRSSWPHKKDHRFTTTWNEIMRVIGPLMITAGQNEAWLRTKLNQALLGYSEHMDDDDFFKIKVQLEALGLVTASYSNGADGNPYTFWNLTPLGKRKVFDLLAVRRELQSPNLVVDETLPTRPIE